MNTEIKGRTSRKGESIEVRVDAQEKEGFKLAAEVAGISLSVWMRERLRQVAAIELERASVPIPFFRGIRGNT
jgi:predicted HicB family RNase H-like nuclease